MQKNVKGFIGLFIGIASFILTIVSLCMLTNPIRDTGFALHGSINVTLALIAAGLGLVAIIFGVMSVRDKDKKGPRKAGIIIGVFAIIAALCSAGICSMTKMVVEYANGESTALVSQMSDAERKEFDKQLNELVQQAKKQAK